MARTKQTARLIDGSFEPFFLIFLSSFFVDMSFIKRAVLRTDSGLAPEGNTGASQPPQQ